MKHILVFGDPVDGLGFIGPFDDCDEAIKYAEENFKLESWWTSELESPKQEEEEIPDDIAKEIHNPLMGSVLDDLVHDAVSQTGSNVNNEGTLAQVRFLRSEGFSWKYIREAFGL